MVESRQTFLHDLLYSFLPFTISKLRGVLVIPILTKLFNPTTYGVWVQYSVTLILITKVAGLGLQNAMNRYLTDVDTRQLQEDYYAILVVTGGTAMTIGLFLLLSQQTTAELLFPTSDGDDVLLVLAAASVLNLYFVQTLQMLRSQRRIKSMNLWRSARILGEVGCLLVGGLFLSSIVEILLGILVVYVSFSMLLSIRVISTIGISIPRFTNLKRYLEFSLPLLLSTLAYWVVNTSDRYVITYFSGLDAVGTYSVVYAIATVIGMVSHPVVNVLFPDLSALEEGGEAGEAKSRFGGVVRYFLLFAVPAIVGSIVLSDSVIRLISTATIARDASLMIILAPSMALYALFNIFIQVLKVNERARLIGLLWGGVAVSNVLLNLILVPVYGITGAAVATFIAFVLGLTAAGWSLRLDLMGMRFNLSRIVLAAGLMGVAVWVLKRATAPLGPALLVVSVLVGVTLYVVFSYLLGIITRSEIRYVRQLLA